MGLFLSPKSDDNCLIGPHFSQLKSNGIAQREFLRTNTYHNFPSSTFMVEWCWHLHIKHMPRDWSLGFQVSSITPGQWANLAKTKKTKKTKNFPRNRVMQALLDKSVCGAHMAHLMIVPTGCTPNDLKFLTCLCFHYAAFVSV